MRKKSFMEQLDSLFTTKESSFIAWFSVFFLGSAALLAAFGFLPSEFQENSTNTSFVKALEEGVTHTLNQNNSEEISKPVSEYSFLNSRTLPSANGKAHAETNIIPDTLVIPAIGVNTVIKNPSSTDIDVLDQELTKGAVRYPGSGTVGNGNMFIFGHSTGYKVVINKAYKVFNDLKTLTKGDVILLQSGSKTYEYTVTTVQKVNKDTTEIIFDNKTNMLTLATCDSFGAKSDRYIVEAVFKGER